MLRCREILQRRGRDRFAGASIELRRRACKPLDLPNEAGSVVLCVGELGDAIQSVECGLEEFELSVDLLLLL